MNIEHLKKRLEEEKVRLESEMGSVGQKNVGVPGDWESVPTETGTEPDSADQADVLISRDTNRAILSALETQYDEVLKALKRIERGSYGACEACGMHIEEARLEAVPSATTCTAHM